MAGYGRLFNVRSCFGICYNQSISRSNVTGYQRCLATKAVSVEEENLPVPPKRPLTPYFRFLISIRPKMVQQYPDMKGTDLVKKIAEEWAKLDPTEKKPFQVAYSNELAIYSNKQLEYENSITDEQRKLIKSKKSQMRKSKNMKLYRQQQDLGKPKKPQSAFMLFMNFKMATKDSSIKYKDWLQLMGKEWNELPKEEKEKYMQVNLELREKYKKELKQWEEKMIRLGNINVVKNKISSDLTAKKSNLE